MNGLSQQSQYCMPPQHAEPAPQSAKQEESEFVNVVNVIVQSIDDLERRIVLLASRLIPLRFETNEKSPHAGAPTLSPIRTDTQVFSLLAEVNYRIESLSYRLEEINHTTVI